MIPESLKEFPIAAAVDAFDAGALTGGVFDRNELTLEIAPEKVVAVCRYLKEGEQFARLSAVTAVDRYPTEPRFEIVYLLHSIERNQRLRLKCRLAGERPEIESVTGVWRAANWYEREVFDLFGVRFLHHPDLRRLLMPEDWEGHPLRKDYPVTGTKYTYTEESGGPQ
jgi:NADH-quinone oxidoreductase subunit C